MSSPGEVARIVNKITKLEDVDGWVATVTSQINQNNRDTTRLDSEIKQEEIILRKYDDIEETGIVIGSLVKNNAELKSLYQAKMVLDTKLEHIEETCKELDRVEDYLLAEKYINKAENFEKEIAIQAVFQSQMEGWELCTAFINKRENDCLGLEILADKLDKADCSELEKQKDKLNDAIFDFEATDKRIAGIDFALSAEKVLGEIKDIQEFVLSFGMLEDAIDKFDSLSLHYGEIAEDIDSSKKEYSRLWQEMKICPVCLSLVNDKQIKKIMEEL